MNRRSFLAIAIGSVGAQLFGRFFRRLPTYPVDAPAETKKQVVVATIKEYSDFINFSDLAFERGYRNGSSYVAIVHPWQSAEMFDLLGVSSIKKLRGRERYARHYRRIGARLG